MTTRQDEHNEHEKLVERHPHQKQHQQNDHHHHHQEQKQHSTKRLGAIALCISFWYISSLVTLFMNKWFMLKDGLNGSPQTLAMAQMVFSALTGALKNFSDKVSTSSKVPHEYKEPVTRRTFMGQMILLGIMRLSTVVLGLVALEHLAVSFTETIKSSAPFVTVVLTRIILRESTSFKVVLSLVPIAFGLGLCSFTEVSFNITGFAAAMSCNCIDCIQNVYSKRLLRHYTPIQLQFFASVAALLVQMPIWVVMLQMSLVENAADTADAANHSVLLPTKYALGYLTINGIFFYLQSVSAYALMDLVSPVTHSVCNCVKRALLIWISVLFWHNKVGLLNAVGTLVLLGGVLLYNHQRRQSSNQASDMDKLKRRQSDGMGVESLPLNEDNAIEGDEENTASATECSKKDQDVESK